MERLQTAEYKDAPVQRDLKKPEVNCIAYCSPGGKHRSAAWLCDREQLTVTTAAILDLPSS